VTKTNNNRKQGHVWLVRFVSAPGYVSLLIAWTSLLGYLAVVIAPFLLLEQGSVIVDDVQMVSQTSNSGADNSMVYIIVLLIVIALWSLLVYQIAKVFTWLQTKLQLRESQLLSVKVGGLSVGWLLFAPVFHSAFAGFGSIYIWLVSGLMLFVGIISFSSERAVSQRYKLKQKVVW